MIRSDVSEASQLGWLGDTTFQIFGHSQGDKPEFATRYAMLDCHRTFRLVEDCNDPVVANRLVML